MTPAMMASSTLFRGVHSARPACVTAAAGVPRRPGARGLRLLRLSHDL